MKSKKQQIAPGQMRTKEHDTEKNEKNNRWC